MRYELFIPTIGIGLISIRFIRRFADLWANKNVRRLFRDGASGLRWLVDHVPTRERTVVAGSPLSTRLWHWAEAGALCIYVAFLLTLAAVIATVAAFALVHMKEIDPIAEMTAGLFICLLLVVADFFYKEALALRSEVTGLPVPLV